MNPTPGLLVGGGRFRLDRPIAKGGMGEVWAGEHCATGMRVALKMLLPEMATHPEVVQRFKREAVLLGRVRSDRVARVIDFLTEPRCGAVLVTEFIEGPSLADATPAPTSVEGAVELGIEIGRALRDLHRARIVHRDLKPGNVILQPLDDRRSRAVLVDLGVSRLVSSGAEEDTDALTDITKTQIVLGTIGYMAPEQILGPREVTPSADLYGLGAILYRLVKGHHVFASMSLVEQMRAKLQTEAPHLRTGRSDPLARGFEAIVSRSLQREPALRYASADEMIAALSSLRDHACRSRPADRGSGARARLPARIGAAALLATVLSMLGAFLGAAVADRGRTSPPAPALQLSSPSSASEAARASTPNEDLQARAGGVMGAGGSGLPAIAAPERAQGSRGVPSAPPARRAPPPGERDAALMRAIRSAVREEAYMTLSIPEPDDNPPSWGDPWPALNRTLTATAAAR